MTIYHKLNQNTQGLKQAVKAHWEAEPCESRAGKNFQDRNQYFREIDTYRYEKSSFIPGFAKFAEGIGRRVLEVGLGSGSDFIRWAQSGASLWGRDLTVASVRLVQERLMLEGLEADVGLGDVEELEFPDDFFDIVYCYGVIHHTPDTHRAVAEIHRVLNSGGVARVMIYNARGLTFFYQWVLFGLLKMQPWRSPREIAFYHNESLGTKLYSPKEARSLFSCFRTVDVQTVVDAGDTFNFELSQRYRQVSLIRHLHRTLKFFRSLKPVLPATLGTTMLIEAIK